MDKGLCLSHFWLISRMMHWRPRVWKWISRWRTFQADFIAQAVDDPIVCLWRFPLRPTSTLAWEPWGHVSLRHIFARLVLSMLHLRELHGISNHLQFDGLLNILFKLTTTKIIKTRTHWYLVGSPMAGEFPLRKKTDAASNHTFMVFVLPLEYEQ